MKKWVKITNGKTFNIQKQSLQGQIIPIIESVLKICLIFQTTNWKYVQLSSTTIANRLFLHHKTLGTEYGYETENYSTIKFEILMMNIVVFSGHIEKTNSN